MKNKKLLSLTLATLLLFSFSVPASANSRAQVWYGTDASGVVFKEGDIPVQVESELLTFDLPTLPYAIYNDAEAFFAYDSKVTAEYTFYNPTDMTITATLLFPFGTRPEYGVNYDSVKKSDKYGVTVNGEKIEANVRHTNNFGYEKFDTDAHIATLSEEFISDDFYTPDLTVTKYSYEIVGHSIPSAFFNINIDYVGSKRKIVLYRGNLGGHITETGFSASGDPKKNEKKTVCFYVFGEPLTTMPNAAWYKNNGTDPDTKIDGEFSYVGCETTTLTDFIFAEYNTESDISEVDWYNACIMRLKLGEEKRGNTCAIRTLFFGSLMRWFEYEITLKPGEKIKNAVTAPMYPIIEAWEQPYEYHYTYLLSPAGGWADFGKLDIVINTPYEMSSSSVEGFEKTENGYKLSRDGLPTDTEGYIDLHFTLLNDGNTPKKQPTVKSNEGFFKRIFNAITSFFARLTEFISNIFKN